MNQIKYKLIEGLFYIFGYSVSFFVVSMMFDSFRLVEGFGFAYSFLAAVLIYLLNKTVKPVLVFLTIPITGVTLGSFYFVLNTIILKIVDYIMMSKLDFTNIWILFFISIVISIINLLIELIIIKPVVKRMKYNG